MPVGGFTDWRLPTALNADGSGPCQFFNCTGSELGHMYYTELGNVAATVGCTIGVNCGLVNTSPFSNLIDSAYWTSTEDALNTSSAWEFATFGGVQVTFPKTLEHFSWAVRDGDVAPIPEPSTLLLFGSGLAGLAVWRSRKGAKSKTKQIIK